MTLTKFTAFGIGKITMLVIAVEGASPFVSDPWSPLLNLGAIGCVLAWFMLRMEPRIRRVEEAIDRNTRAGLLTVLSMKDVSDAIKEQATHIINELSVVDAERNRK